VKCGQPDFEKCGSSALQAASFAFTWAKFNQNFLGNWAIDTVRRQAHIGSVG
jgi:hypothetical protein